MEKDERTLDDVLDGVIDPKDPEPDNEDPKNDDADDPKADDPKNDDADDPKADDPKADDPKNDPTPEPTDEDSEDEGDDDPKPDEDDKPKKKGDSSVIRNLRKQQKESSQQVKQYEQMLDKLAKQQGITKDELVEKLQTEADQKEAKEKDISPEIQKQLREQQEALDNLKQERQREVFNSKFDKLTEEHPMDNDQAREFVQSAIDMGVDLGNPNTDFKAVYIALNHESIIEKAREEERQNTLKRIEEQNKKSPGLNKKRNQSDGTKKGNLDDALADIFG